jgi:hypothetical protein
MLLQIVGSSSLADCPLEGPMESLTASPPAPTTRPSGTPDVVLSPSEPIVIVVGLIAVVTTLAFMLLATIGNAPL